MPLSLEFAAARLPKDEMLFDFCNNDVYLEMRESLLVALNIFGKTHVNASLFPLIKDASG